MLVLVAVVHSQLTASPILGQLWYNTSNNSLNVCYAEASGTVAAKFKSLSKLNAGDTAPTDADQGQFWYDLVNGQLNIWSGSEYITIGPEIGANIKAKWRGDFEYNALVPDLPVFNIKAVLGTSDEVVAIVSAETYDMSDACLCFENINLYKNCKRYYLARCRSDYWII